MLRQQSINILAFISISILLTLNITRGDGVVVRKKVKIPKDRDDSAGDTAREGRHLGLQCSPYQCQNSLSTANICCARNFNLNCCFYNPGALSGPLYSSPAVARPTIWSPPAPFSLGLSVHLSEPQPIIEDVPHYYPPEDNHHHDHHYDDHHHGHHGHDKPGECPLPDTDYYNGPNHYHDNIPLVPGLGHNSLSQRSCSYDSDCRANMKCCHLKVGHHKIVMHCR